MSLAVLLPALPGLLVEQAIIGEETITLVARLTTAAMPCPACAQLATHVHRRARRTLCDVPAGGRSVRLCLQVRHFFCSTPTCPRTTFTEQVPDLAAPYARRTTRLQATLRRIGLALGGEAGARLAAYLGRACSPDTLLRLVRQTVLPPLPTPRVLGVDDWSFCKRRSFGTILVDLERQRPVDLVPDREAETLAAWLRAHPGVEMATRDRSRRYAQGLRLGAPDAIQAADRWHLLKNLAEALEGFFLHKKQLFKEALPRSRPPPANQPPPAPWLRGRTNEAEAPSLSRHAHFIDLYHQIHALEAKQVRGTDSAERLRICRGTVYHYLGMDQPPERKPAQDRCPRPLDRFKSYLLERWNDGCRTARQLWKELVTQGYGQSSAPVQRFIGGLRQETGHRHKFKQAEAASLYTTEEARQRPLTAVQAAYLFTAREEQRSTWQQKELDHLCEQDPTIAQVYTQGPAFCTMVRDRQGHQFDQWLAEVQERGIAKLRSFAKGLKKDYDAVKAGLTLSWSHGQTEGQNHRLKVLKRQRYGRARFDLLRLRVLSPGRVDAAAQPGTNLTSTRFGASPPSSGGLPR
jgi:transposase